MEKILLNISIVEECNENNRLEKEIYWINKLKTYDRDYGYNLFVPNKNKFKCSDETKLKLHISNKKRSIPIDVYSIHGEYLNSFDSSNQCCRYYNIRTSYIITQLLNKKRKSYKSMVFVKKGEPFNYIPSSKWRNMTKFIKN